MPEELFDLSEEYQQMLDQGISLSGESMFFFIEGRLNALRAHLPSQKKILNILDFGCGIGHGPQHGPSTAPWSDVPRKPPPGRQVVPERTGLFA